MLSSAEQALAGALKKSRHMRSGLLLLTLVLLASLLLLLAFGFEIALFVAPLLVVPVLILPWLCRGGEDVTT